MALGSTIIYIFLLLVAIPICEENSGREEAKIISPHVTENTCIVSYRKKYSGSLVFYLNKKVYRLENDAGFEKLKPQKMSWTSLNVMPFMHEKDLPLDKKIIILVDDEREKNFSQLPIKNWKLLAKLKNSKIYISDL